MIHVVRASFVLVLRLTDIPCSRCASCFGVFGFLGFSRKSVEISDKASTAAGLKRSAGIRRPRRP